MKKLFVFSFLVGMGLLSSCNSKQESQSAATDTTTHAVSIIPQPAHVQSGTGNFTITTDTKLVVDAGSEELKKIAQTLADKLKTAGGPALAVTEGDAVENSIFSRSKPPSIP